MFVLGDGCVVTAQPVLPGKTGMLNFVADANGVRAYIHPDAQEQQRKMFDDLRKRGEQVVAELIATAPRQFGNALRRGNNLSLADVFRKLNANGDDVLTLQEIESFEVLDTGKSLGSLLNLREIMGFGAGGESFLNLSMGLLDISPCDKEREKEHHD